IRAFHVTGVQTCALPICSRVAALTPAVALAATRGDPAAREVLAEAGRELARLATVVFGRLGQVMPVALAGGVAGAGPELVEPMQIGRASGRERVLMEGGS